jgi:PII-like signaling protein
MNAPVKLLLLFVNEADTWHNRPLYQAIVERLHQLEIAGATAQTGLMGFGHHMRMHHKGLFGIADDRPVTVMVVDEEVKLRAVVPELRQMLHEGLIVLLDAEVVADTPTRT